jgi:hypothetical protein
MKYIVMILAVVLAGCTPSAQEQTFPVVPEGLKDCKFYKLTDESANTIRVVRCPGSSTSMSYKTGKTRSNSIVIDGVEYTKK